MSNKNLNLYINQELIKKAKKHCIDEDCSLSDLVTRLLLEYFKKEKE